MIDFAGKGLNLRSKLCDINDEEIVVDWAKGEISDKDYNYMVTKLGTKTDEIYPTIDFNVNLQFIQERGSFFNPKPRYNFYQITVTPRTTPVSELCKMEISSVGIKLAYKRTEKQKIEDIIRAI